MGDDSNAHQFDAARDIPSLAGRVFIVTGGNIGLGQETVLQLARHNPEHIFVASRSPEKAEQAMSQIKKSVPLAKLSFLPLDLASFESIKAAADKFNASSDRLDVLINNAGIMACPSGLTKEGYELQFGTNHVGHALLIRLLLPVMKRTAKEPNADVRIVTLSSGALNWAPQAGLILADAKSPMESYSTWERYGQSKLANMLYSRRLAQEHPEILCVAVHPGSVRTNLISGPRASYPLFSPFLLFFSTFMQLPVQKGAWNQLWSATAPRSAVKSGTFYYPFRKEVQGSVNAQRKDLETELWDWTEKELSRAGF